MRFVILAGFIIVGSIITQRSYAQSTSWTGQLSTNWKTAGNWTNGVPDATKDAVIGDGAFLGTNLPTLPAGAGSGVCKNLTLINNVLTILSINDDLTVNGTVTIGAGCFINHNNSNFIVTGDWMNNGSYVTSSSNRRVYFSGTNQTIGGSTVTDFEKVYVSTGSTVTLAQNLSVSNFMSVSGTFDPTEAFNVTGGGDINVSTNGTARVKTTTLAGNYPGVTVNSNTSTSTIDYASAINAQTVSTAINYRRLAISGGTTKTLAGNLSIANDVAINAGTLDLSTFTANRTSSGGSFTMASGTTLRIGGTNTFPANYTTRTLAATSTVEYYGAAQTVTALTYGNLILSIPSGTVTKTMPGTAFTVAGNFTANANAGTLSFTAASNITLLGNVTLSASSTFTGSTFSHTVGGSWVNSGTYSGCGGTVTFTGAGATLSGAGSYQFGNLVFTGNGFVVNAATSLTVCGNFQTSGGGTFTHTTGGAGTLSFVSATAKTISGSNITFDDVTISAGSINTSSSFTIAGDFTATGTFTATTGTMTWSGTAKTFGGAGAVQAAGLSVTGSYSVARDISISANFSVSGTYTAASNTTFFNGSSTFSGTASLFNIQISNSSTLIMGGNATLRVAGTQVLGVSATLNTSLNTPNTFVFNSTGAQSIVYTSFNNVTVSNGNTKTPSAGLTIGGTLTISAATTFAAGTFTHSIAGNFVNSGTFTAGTSTVTLNGTLDASITGSTTFNVLTLSKGTSNVVNLNNNITVSTLNMTSGKMLTGANAVTITTTRTGSGIILGTITRTHAFTTGTNYEFEGPDNFINFSAAVSVTSITVTVVNASITNFPSGSAINRKYTITVTAVSYTANLRLHYEQAELNGNSEGAMTMWNDQGINVWLNRTKSSNDIGNNWVQLDGQSSIGNSWTMSDGQSILSWTGAVSTAWDDAGNWVASGGSPGPIPTLNEVVQIGNLVFTNQPVIATAAQAKNITFYSTTASTLSIVSSGVLVVQGNIQGSWTSNATHTINVGSRIVTTFSDLILSDGTVGHAINLTGTTGFVNVNGALTQSGGANITFTSSGNLSISGNYNYASGTYSGTPSGVVTYNGSTDQTVANITYQNLVIDKLTGLATTSTSLTINGNLQILTSGTLNANGALTVGGNVEVASGTTLNTPSSNISVAGDWLMNGTFNAGSGTVTFNGTGAQSMTASTFNNVVVNKLSGTLTLGANIFINGDININSGTVDVNSRDVTRTTTGGSATLGAGATARFSGTGLQIINFSGLIANPTSTVEYYGTSVRPIPPVIFGNLILSNGGSNAKTMVAATTVLGDLTVNTGATLVLPPTTLNVSGSITAAGTFDATPGTLILDGTSKNLINTGTVTYNNVVVNGSYTVSSGNLNFNGHLQVNGSLNLGNATVNSSGDLTNSGTLFSSGTVTFLGTGVQTIRLLNAVSSTSTGVINFNGTVSPVLNSNSSPTFATVNINNSAPVTASESWTVLVGMTVASGSTWNAGPFTHNISGNFTNNGTVTSSGHLRFVPVTSVGVNIGSGLTSTGKITFGGTGAITVSGSTSSFASIDITNTNAAGITMPTAWSLSNDLLIGPGATLNAGTLSHTVGGTWTNNGTFNGNTSTVTFTSTTTTDEILGSGTSNFNNIVFAPGATITGVAPINVSGDWTNNATSVVLQTGRVQFNGTGTSNISGTTLTDFHDLEINKTSGVVQLQRDITINSSLTLTAGPFSLNGHRTTVTDPTNTAVATTGGYILSESQTYASLFDWVIGTDLTTHSIPYGTSAGVAIPLNFTLSSGDAGTLSTSTYGTPTNNRPLPPGVGHIGDIAGLDNSANTVDRFFLISPTGGASPVATVTFTASAAEVGGITNLVAQRWNGSNWDAPLVGQSNTATSATVPGIATFSTWAMSGNANALPIELSSLNALLSGNKVLLQWETASEKNNDFFEVQKSTNGKDFFAIGTVKGSGTTTDPRTYLFKDYEISKGRLFYRLRQIDFDKNATMSGVVAVNVGDLDPIDFQVTPNPVIEKLSISSSSSFLDNMLVTVFDASGKVIHKKEQPDFGQDSVTNIDMASLAPGVYVVNIDYGGFTKSYRVVKRQ